MLTIAAMNIVADRVPAEVIERVTGSADGELLDVRTELLVDNPENMTTAALRRYRGTSSDGVEWSVVAKALRPASESPLWDSIPDEFRPDVLRNLDWHGEPRLYELGLDAHLPEGLRTPEIYLIDRRDDSITIWMEDIADHSDWSPARYRRTAVALGRMSGRWPEAVATTDLGLRRRNLHNLFFGKITNLDLRILADDAFWESPPISDLTDLDLRADLFELAERMPGLLDRAETLPHGMAHGDAAPANLLEPGDGTIVAIDWSYGSCGPVGCDLSQLVAGRYDCGEASPTELESVVPEIVEGFCEGLAAEGSEVTRSQVEAAFAIHLGVRTVFSLLIIEAQGGLPADEVRRLVGPRAALARAGLDLCAAV